MSEGQASVKQFCLGLIVGKFSPLHFGHEWLISQAAAQCERLLLLSYSKPEFAHCEVAARRGWFAARFPQHESLIIEDAWLAEACSLRNIAPRPLPFNDSSDEVHQQFLAWLVTDILQRTPDAFFCSEHYGPATANILGIAPRQHVTSVMVDRDRVRFPVSASQLRAAPIDHRHWMAPEVAASFVHRIAILGGESSGKTTLAAALAAHFGTFSVPEFGRELWEQQSGLLSESDLLKIAQEQIRREDELLLAANGYLFCDTSPLTTAGYGIWMFGRSCPELAQLSRRPYDAIVLCSPDFPFVQDGTRRDDSFRRQQHEWYLGETANLKCPVLEITGNVTQRVQAVSHWLSSLKLC